MGLYITALAMLTAGAAGLPAQEPVQQWAVRAYASSQPGPATATADQATGEPNASANTDDNHAWAPAQPDGAYEWLELVYRQAVRPTQIRIYETCKPGFVVSVQALDYGTAQPVGGALPEGHGHRWVTLWKGQDPTVYPGPFMPPIERVSFRTNRLRVTIDSSVPGLNEIDAVVLLGTDPVDAAPGTDVAAPPADGAAPGPPAAQGEDPRVGQKVEVFWGGQWWPATILKVNGDQAYIHFDGHDDGWDQWTPPDKIRARAGQPEPPDAAAPVPDPPPANPPPANPPPPAAPDAPPADPAPPAAEGPPGAAKAGVFDGVYYIQMILVQAHTATYAVFVFFPDGRVYRGADRGGTEGFDFDAALAEAPDKCGTYTVNGNEITINYADGRQQTSKLFASTGTYGHPTPRYPADFTLNGNWRADSLPRKEIGGGQQDLYTFSPDGKLTVQAQGNMLQGTYSINGNTLEMRGVYPNVYRRAIWTFPDTATSHSPHFLNIGAIMYTCLDQ
jgi:hypothetical protein